MSAQTIFRVAYRHKPYSMLGNAMLQDERLSPEACRILVFALSLPITWQFNLLWMADKCRMGRNRARAAMNELQALGYCKRRQTRNSAGKMGGYEVVFSDDPLHLAEPETEDGAPVVKHFAPEPEEPAPGKPAPGFGGAYKEKQKRKRNNKKTPLPPKGGEAGSLDQDLEGKEEGCHADTLAPSPPNDSKPRALTAAEKAEGFAIAKGWDRPTLLGEFYEETGADDGKLRGIAKRWLAFCRHRGPHKSTRLKLSTPVDYKKKPPEPKPGEFPVYRSSSYWQPWLNYADNRDPALGDAMRASFMAFVTSPLPAKGSPLPRVPALPSKRAAA